MSEHVSFNPERHQPNPESTPEKPTVPEKHQEHHEQTKHHEAKLDDLRQNIEQQAVSGKEISVGENESTSHTNTRAVTKDLKLRAYWRTIHRIQARLTPRQRVASRVIHQPTIDKISSVSSQTVARSFGLLCGAIFALVGSLILISFTKRSGIHYNYLVFFLLFIIGYVIGLFLELIGKLVRPKH